MMEIRLSFAPGEVRIALLKDDELLDAALWLPGKPDGWGDVHVARITTHSPTLGGAFVELAAPSPLTGFLTGKKLPPEGSLVCARIIRGAQNGKGVRLKLHPLPQGSELGIAPRRLSSGPTPLEEMAQRYKDAPILLDSARLAASLPTYLRPRIQRVPQSFDETLEAEWAALLSPEAELSPLKAHITPTPALTAIDLDSASQPDFATNVACFPALLRQIRLRNLSGTILIDPAGVKSNKRPALVPFLEKANAQEDDPLAPRILGITPSGLLEITRPRRRAALHEHYTSPHGQALAILHQILAEGLTGAQLSAPPAIIHALENDLSALDDFHYETGRKLTLQCRPLSPTSCWSLS